jgi:outer membrane protein, heavy metal efflux system
MKASPLSFGLLAALMVVLVAGCTGVPAKGEIEARENLKAVAGAFRPHNQGPMLPTLGTNAGLSNFLYFAVLNQPDIEAAYYKWAASVERITVERSRPDPRLTFGADIASVVMAVMPGLMIDLPGPGKLRAAANAATAESGVAYFEFKSSALRAAYNLKRAYYQLYFLEHRIGVNRQMLDLLSDIERIARARNEAAQATLQDVLRAQIEQERLTTEVANLEDSRNVLHAQFKAALGLQAADPNPPIPARFESTSINMPTERLLDAALAHNPRLRAIEAEVRQADALIRVAERSRVPDFSAGIEAEVKAAPLMWSPQASVTLPIWRDKIAAQIAAAQAQKRVAHARLSSEQIALAVEFAERSFMLRESERNLDLLRERLLPKAQNSLDVARSGYTSARATFIDLIDAERTLLEFQLREIEAKTQRELALAELSLLILGEPPSGVTVLSQAKPPETLPGQNNAPR